MNAVKKTGLRILSRKSPLALRQVQEVLSALPGLAHDSITVQTYGDKHREVSLLDGSPTDLFTRELDRALLANKGDVAIHSAKDLPFPLPEGLEVIALTKATDKTDALVSRGNLALSKLPPRAVVGTSSLMRRKQILKKRPDAKIAGIRGLIHERLALVDSGKLDAVVVASCALERLGLRRRIAQILPFETHPLQGHLAIVARLGRKDLVRLFAPLDIRRQWGTVYLLGAGPGDPELLTLKADKILHSADVIYYDCLVPRAGLDRYHVVKVCVGKRKNHAPVRQEEINRRLYHDAVAGKTVVRMKGGDPLLFGRGGEELRYLKERLVSVTIVPGVTAVCAAAADAGIPLTERGTANCAAFCAGHPIDKIAVPRADTLVYYMGASTLGPIIQKVLANGWPAQTPAAIIRNASLPDRQIIRGTLEELAKRKTAPGAPSIVIIGAVARNAQKTEQHPYQAALPRVVSPQSHHRRKGGIRRRVLAGVPQ